MIILPIFCCKSRLGSAAQTAARRARQIAQGRHAGKREQVWRFIISLRTRSPRFEKGGRYMARLGTLEVSH